MKKTDLIASLKKEGRSEELCKELVDAVFEKLKESVSLQESLNIDGIGHFGAHLRKGANKELPNKEGKLSQKNLSIFFHPNQEIKKEVTKHVEEA